MDWLRGSAFDTLGWSPDGRVRGSYTVLVREDGRDFLIVGVGDMDADGQQAIYFASGEARVTQVSGPDVH